MKKLYLIIFTAFLLLIISMVNVNTGYAITDKNNTLIVGGLKDINRYLETFSVLPAFFINKKVNVKLITQPLQNTFLPDYWNNFNKNFNTTAEINLYLISYADITENPKIFKKYFFSKPFLAVIDLSSPFLNPKFTKKAIATFLRNNYYVYKFLLNLYSVGRRVFLILSDEKLKLVNKRIDDNFLLPYWDKHLIANIKNINFIKASSFNSTGEIITFYYNELNKNVERYMKYVYMPKLWF